MRSPQPLLDALEPRLLMAAGVVDTSFRGDGLFTDSALTAITDLAVQSNGKIVAVGYRNDALGANSDMIVTRYNRNGTLDTSFGNGGRVTIDFGSSSRGAAVAIAKNGDIVVAGSASGGGAGSVGSDVAVARLNSNGTLDSAFSSDGMVITNLGAASTHNSAVDVGIDNRNRIVVAARDNSDQSGGGWTLIRYLPSGALDDTFNNDGVRSESGGTINAIEVLKNGKVLAAGQLDQSCAGGAGGCSSSSATIIRYTEGGSPDARFGVGGFATSSFEASGAENVAFTDIALQGKNIVAVGLDQTQARTDVIAARFNKNGIRDNVFNPPDFLGGDRSALRASDVRLGVQPDNKLIVALTSSTLIGGEQNFAVARLRSGGAFDDSFDGDGLANIVFENRVSTLHALALQKQTGRIIAAGRAFDVSPGNPETGLAAMAALEGFKELAGPDRSAPRAVLEARPVPHGASSEFTVRYIDNRGIDRSTIDDHDIVVSGPGGFSESAKLVRINGSGKSVRAIYSIDAPGGSWNRTDEGRYTITLQPHEVADEAGNFEPSKVLGRFKVKFPPRP